MGVTQQPNRSRTKVLRTIFIGLGGTGDEIIRRVKREMIQHGYDLPTFQYLVLDTVPYKEDPSRHPLMRLRNEEEYLYIGDYNPNEILKNLGNWPTISGWWGDRTSKGITIATVDEGAGQMRAVGRMGFFRHFKVINERFERMVRSVTSVENREALLQQGYEVPPNRAPIIYLMFSLCGGTGSSLFIDVAYVLRQLFAASNIKPTIVAMAILPGPYMQQIDSNLQRERLQANTYAALQELERLHSMGLGHRRRNSNIIWDVQYTSTFRVASADLPFDYIYLIDDKAGNETYTREQIYDLVSQGSFWLSGPSTALRFWERATNLISNTLAAGGSPDASGHMRLSKYSSLGIGAIAIDREEAQSQRILENLIFEKISTVQPGRPVLPSWMERADALVREVSEPFAPMKQEPSQTFKNLAGVDDMLERFNTNYIREQNNPQRQIRWQDQKDRYATRFLYALNETLTTTLRARGPFSATEELKAMRDKIQNLLNDLGTLEVEYSRRAGEALEKYDQIRQNFVPKTPLASFLVLLNRFMRGLVGIRGSKAERELKVLARGAAKQQYSCFYEQFRMRASKELSEQVVKPMISYLESKRYDLEDAKDVIRSWRDRNDEEIARTKAEQQARKQAIFEAVIYVPPFTTEEQQVEQFLQKSHIDIIDLTIKVLDETFKNGLKMRSVTESDMQNALAMVAIDRLRQLGEQEHVLQRLCGYDGTSKDLRETLLQRAECLWSIQNNATQQVSANLENILFLGVGEDLEDLVVQNQINVLLGTQTQRKRIENVSTGFSDELVFLKTVHGLPVTLLHGMTELHSAYQTMSIVRKAPYLHLDNRENVELSYMPLVQFDMTNREIVERWNDVVRDLKNGKEAVIADLIEQLLKQYKAFREQAMIYDDVVQVRDDQDILFQLVNLIESYLDSRPQTTVISTAYIALADLKGLLYTRGWKKTMAGKWVQIV